MGETKKDISNKGVSLKDDGNYWYTTEELPKGNSKLTKYDLLITPKSGLCRILSHTDIMYSNSFGNQLKSEFEFFEKALTKKYGDNEKYDFVEMPDPMAVLMGDSSGVSKNAKPGQPITLRQRLQALHQINPLAREMSVDMILGGKSDPGRDIKNIMTKLGGIVDFFTLNSFDLDNQGGPTLLNPSGKEQTPAEPIEEKTKKKLDSKPKLTAQQIKKQSSICGIKRKVLFKYNRKNLCELF